MKAKVDPLLLNTGTAAALHRGPGPAQQPPCVPGAGHPVGAAPDGGASPGDGPAGVAAVPGPTGGHQGPAQQRPSKAAADGAEVPATGQLAEGYGDQRTAAWPSKVRPHHQGRSAGAD